MKYLDRFKARMGRVAAAYTAQTAGDAEIAPKRPMTGLRDESLMPAANVLVDIIITCKIKGIAFGDILEVSEKWAEYEWQMVEPLVEAARNPMGQSPQQAPAAA